MWLSRRNFSKVSASLIKQLREQTGSPLKDCMKVLEESDSNLEVAFELLRKRGLADAAKRTGRETAEGLVAMIEDKKKCRTTMVQLHCETDFVAKTKEFQLGLRAILESIHNKDEVEPFCSVEKPDLLEKHLAQLTLVSSLDPTVSSQTVHEALQHINTKTQENCKLAKVLKVSWNPEEGQVCNAYIHQVGNMEKGLGRIGSLVLMEGSSKEQNLVLEEVTQQLAMHIAAMKPIYLNKKLTPQEVKDKAKEIGGEKELWKLFKQQVLMEQELATVDEKIIVKQFIRSREAEVHSALTIKQWALFQI